MNDDEIIKLREIIKDTNYFSLSDKILSFSKFFIGKPYNFELGEEIITWDQNREGSQLINTESLDCISYVEIVLALSKITTIPKNNDEFLNLLAENLAKIMFSSTDINYITRNHFTDTEWLVHNKNIISSNPLLDLGYIKNKVAKINKAGFLETQLTNYANKHITENKRGDFLEKYKTSLKVMRPVISKVKYISFADFLAHEKTLSNLLNDKVYILTKIMDNPKLLDLTNSEHNISHIGLVFTNYKKLMLRHATSIGSKSVEEVSLEEFCKEKMKSKIFLGISLNKLKS